MLVRRLVYFIVPLGFEEEVSGLAGDHRNQPANQRRRSRVPEDQRVGGQKAQGADQMQGLVNAAVMVVAMIVPALQFQCAQEAIHRDLPSIHTANAVRL